MNLSPVHHKEPFLAVTFFLGVDTSNQAYSIHQFEKFLYSNEHILFYFVPPKSQIHRLIQGDINGYVLNTFEIIVWP